MATDATDNVIITGGVLGTVDFGGGVLTSAGSADAFVARFTSAGAHSWSKRFGGESHDSGVAVTTDSAGNVLCSGTFLSSLSLGGATFPAMGQMDTYVGKFSSAGAHQWSRSFGSVADESVTALAVDADDNVILTGFAWFDLDFGGGILRPAGQSDVFVARLAPDGTHLWSELLGGLQIDSGFGVAVDAAGRIAITGSFAATASFGGKPVTSSGGSDVYVARIHR